MEAGQPLSFELLVRQARLFSACHCVASRRHASTPAGRSCDSQDRSGRIGYTLRRALTQRCSAMTHSGGCSAHRATERRARAAALQHASVHATHARACAAATWARHHTAHVAPHSARHGLRRVASRRRRPVEMRPSPRQIRCSCAPSTKGSADTRPGTCALAHAELRARRQSRRRGASWRARAGSQQCSVRCDAPLAADSGQW